MWEKLHMQIRQCTFISLLNGNSHKIDDVKSQNLILRWNLTTTMITSEIHLNVVSATSFRNLLSHKRDAIRVQVDNARFIVVMRSMAIKNGNKVGIDFDTSANTDLAIVSRAPQRISRYATCIRYYNLTRGGMRRSFDKRKRERVSGDGR